MCLDMFGHVWTLWTLDFFCLQVESTDSDKEMWFVGLKCGFQSIDKFRSASCSLPWSYQVIATQRVQVIASMIFRHQIFHRMERISGKDPERLLLSPADLRPKLLACHLATLVADVARPTRPIGILAPIAVPKMRPIGSRKVFTNDFLTTLNILNIRVRSEMQKQVEARPGHLGIWHGQDKQTAKGEGRPGRLKDLKGRASLQSALRNL